MFAGNFAGETVTNLGWTLSQLLTWASTDALTDQQAAGLRFGEKGTHTSRTMMLSELTDLLAVVPRDAAREDYAEAIIGENVLGKETASNRRLTNQRLGELYGLDPTRPIFRVLLHLWDIDEVGRPLLALLCALGRDPLLRATAPPVLDLAPGEELLRSAMTDAIQQATDDRLKDSVTDKVARNTGSSWTQSGHLEGRVRKKRRQVQATPGAMAFALWLGTVQGLAGEDLLRSAWARVLDGEPSRLLELAFEAKRLRLVEARAAGGVVEIDARGLDPVVGGG